MDYLATILSNVTMVQTKLITLFNSTRKERKVILVAYIHSTLHNINHILRAIGWVECLSTTLSEICLKFVKAWKFMIQPTKQKIDSADFQQSRKTNIF